jgi:putative membrane protein
LVDALHNLPAADRERARKAAEAARHSTVARFDFIVVPASDHYALFPEVWAAAIALVLTGVLALFRPWLSIGTGFAVTTVLFIAFSVVLEWWPLRVRLVPRFYKRICASRMARHQFAAHLISKDQEHNGVMLFVSLAERHLEIIAERDAHAAVPAGTWERIVSDATSAMRGRGPAVGLVNAISECGRVLAQPFPRRT